MNLIKTLSIFLLFCFSQNTYAQHYLLYFPSNDAEVLEFQRPKQMLLAWSTSFSHKRNIQAGYSPLPHLSLAASYMDKTIAKETNNQYNTQRRAYTFAAGTYIFLSKKAVGEVKLENTVANHLRGVLLSAQLGFSYNSIESQEFIVRESDSRIKYNSAFLTIGLAYQSSWGLFKLTGSFKQLYYTEAVFNGPDFRESKVTAITEQLREETRYNIFSLGIHSQIGRKAARVIAGGTIPQIYFQDFKNNAAEIENSFFYLGLMLDIKEAIQWFKT